MATKPTPGGSDGTYGTEMNAFLDVSLASDGKVKDGAVFETSAAPTVDAGVVPKKYVDEATLNPGTIKAWVNFDGDDGSINGNHNVSGVVRTAAGVYTVSWDTNFASANYAIAGFCADAARFGFVTRDNDTALTAGSALIKTIDNLTDIANDFNTVTIIAIGAQ